jgi:AraC family transcriptional regulator
MANGIIKLNSLAELGFMPAPVCTSDRLGWSGFKLERYFSSVDIPLAEKFYPSHVIGIALGGQLKNNFPVIGGRRDISYRQGESLLCLAGLAHTAYEPRAMDLLMVYIEPGFVERAARDLIAGGRIEIVPQLKLEDDFVGDISRYLLREAEAGGATGILYAESLMTALAAHLVKNYSAVRLLPKQSKGGLAKYKLRRVVEFINENLSENLSLNTLAALCDLSAVHFAKAFKQSTGLAPHAFVNLRRVERSKELLQNSRLTVTEIAASLGFTNHSHLAKVFRRFVGTSPTVYQTEIRSK